MAAATRKMHADTRSLHFVRLAADDARFFRVAPDASHLRVGEVSVARRASTSPAVDRVILWTGPHLSSSPTTPDDTTEDIGDVATVADDQTVSERRPRGSGANVHHRPLLKSAIQKCVRRQMPAEAARFARGLADAGGASDLLRRAVVVLIEDAIASPRLPVLVWLMAAHSKGFALTGGDIGLVANVMGQAAALVVRDCVPPAESAPHLCARLGAPHNHPIVDALLLRVCYGGTPGDMRMLARAASLWQARLGGSASALWTESLAALFGPGPLDSDSNTGRVVVDDPSGDQTGAMPMAPEKKTATPARDCVPLVATVPVEAADFHCFPRMCADVVAATAGGFTPEVVREAIWHHRSSVNLKRPWTDPREPLSSPLARGVANVPDDRVDMDAVVRTARCWTAISKHVDRIARQAIERVASTAVAAQEPSVDTRAGQKRDRVAAQIDARPATHRPRKGARQRSIRSFFAAPRPL